MGHQESLELYLNLSRRELQLLCKKKNLPANRSHAQLARSLALLSKRKNAVPSPSKMKLTPNPKESGNTSEDKSKDFVGAYERSTRFLGPDSNNVTPKEKEGANKQHSMAENLMTTGSHMDHQASDNVYAAAANAFSLDSMTQKQSDCSTSKTENSTQGGVVTSNVVQIVEEVQLGHELHLDGTLNELAVSNVVSKSETHNQVLNILPRVAKNSTKGGFLSSKEVSKEEIPSFQFFVMAEDGINLHVHLNSSPSEWINDLKDGVSINLKTQNSMSSIFPSHTQHFSQEADEHMKVSVNENVGRYLHSNIFNRNSDCTTSTLSSDSENCQLVASQPEATFVSSDSSILTSSSIPVKMPEYLNRNQVTSSVATPLSEQKHMSFDELSCPGDRSTFSVENTSSGMEKSNATAIDISMGVVSATGMLSSDGTRHLEQLECFSPKTNEHSNFVDTSCLGNSLASIPEENNPPKSDGSGKVTLISDQENIVINNGVSKSLIEGGHGPESSDVAAHHDRSFNLCERGEHLPLDCPTAGLESDTTSVGHIRSDHALDLASVATDSVVNHEVGESTLLMETKTSECSLPQKSSNNNSKRSHNFEFQGDFRNKRNRSSVEKKNGMMVNLRSTRMLGKGTICEQVIRPRRSSRLQSI